MNAHIRHRVTTLALAAATLATMGVGLAAAGPATAATSVTSRPGCTPATVATAQQALEAALQSRVTELASLTTDVQNATGLTATDRATVSGTLSTTSSGIQSLVGEAPSAATCLAVWQEAKSMVQNYRVFAVVAPQTHLDIAADTADGIETTLADQEPNIQSAITASGKDGVNTTAAQASFADLQSQVTAAQGLTSGVPATVLAQTPASYPGSSPVFVSARNALRSGFADLKQADADLQAIVADLK